LPEEAGCTDAGLLGHLRAPAYPGAKRRTDTTRRNGYNERRCPRPRFFFPDDFPKVASKPGPGCTEAARELGCPRGTIAALVTRGRERLWRRLVRRDVTLSAGALGREAAAAAVPGALEETTVRAALAFAAGTAAAGGVVPARLAALSEEVIRSMRLSTIRFLVAAGLALGPLGAGAGTVAYRTATGAPPAAPRQGEDRPAAEDEVTKLAQERLEAAREVYRLLQAQIKTGSVSPQELCLWSPHLLDAELDVATTKAERVAALKAHVNLMKDNERFVKALVDVGRAPATELGKAKVLRLEAELRLAKEKAK
jgi:hypothetical protein